MSISRLLRRRAPARPCGLAAGDLDAYADGQLEGAARACVEQHLAGCAPCRRVLDELRSLATLLADALTPPLSRPEDRSRALARVKDRIGPSRLGEKPAWLGWWRLPDSPLPVLAGALIVLVALADTISFGGMEELAVTLALYLELV